MEFVGHHFDQESGVRDARYIILYQGLQSFDLCLSCCVRGTDYIVLQSGGVWRSPEVDDDWGFVSSSVLPDYLCNLLLSQFGRRNFVSTCA
jgi:hypothetical protein